MRVVRRRHPDHGTTSVVYVAGMRDTLMPPVRSSVVSFGSVWVMYDTSGCQTPTFEHVSKSCGLRVNGPPVLAARTYPLQF